jgi:tetratricopeptide (TPR) repeat protein
MAALRSLFLAVAVSALPSALSAPAFAGPPDAKHADPLKEGLELAKAGKFEAALAKFEEAYALARTGTNVYNMARMEHALGRHALALHHYREALRDPALAAESRRDAERAIEELKTKIAVIAFDVPAGATTMLDGNEIDPSFSVEVVPGPHLVKIKLGGAVKSSDVTAPAGVVTTVKLRFDEAAAKPEGAPADDPTKAPRPPEDGGSLFTTKNLVAGSLGALGVAATAVGIGFFAASEKSLSDAESFDRSVPGGACTGLDTCTRYDGMLDDARDSRGIATVSLIAAGVLVTGAIAAFTLWPSDKSEKERTSAVGVRPLVGPISGLAGTF